MIRPDMLSHYKQINFFLSIKFASDTCDDGGQERKICFVSFLSRHKSKIVVILDYVNTLAFYRCEFSIRIR